MADVGIADDLINASEVSLSDGTDTYLQLQELTVNIGRPEVREESVDGVHYFYGKGDNYIEGTILASVPEIKTLIDFTELSSTAAPVSKDWVITYNGVGTTTSPDVNTLHLTGTMAPLLRIEKQITGGVKLRIRIRITESVEVIAGNQSASGSNDSVTS